MTREAIRRRLWPGDTFVDFEHILNNTINRLREELRGSHEKPVFIETLPRQGYRFICPVAGRSAHRSYASIPSPSCRSRISPAILNRTTLLTE